MNELHLWENLRSEAEVRFIRSVYETFDKNQTKGKIVREGFANHDPELAHIPKSLELKDFEVGRGINIDKSYFDPVIGCEVFLVEINWDKFQRFAELVHDREADKPRGKEKQKEILREVILKARRAARSPELEISEKILGTFYDRDDPFVSTSESRPEREVQLMAALRWLESDGWLKILNVNFDFEAQPTPTEESKHNYMYSYGTQEYHHYYPAKHCLVRIKLLQNESGIAIDDEVSFIPKITSRPPFLQSETEATTEELEQMMEDLDDEDSGQESPKDEVVYEVTYNDLREVKINGILIAKPTLAGENDLIFSTLIKNPNKRLSRQEIEKEASGKINKSLSGVPRDLGFKGELRKIFFTGTSKNNIKLINPIKRSYLEANNLKEVSIKDFEMKKSEKK